jgi:hypothetical protein
VRTNSTQKRRAIYCIVPAEIMLAACRGSRLWRSGQGVSVQAVMRAIFGSNFDWSVAILTENYQFFSQSFPANARTVPWNWPLQFPSNFSIFES